MTQQELFVKMALAGWDTAVDRTSKTFNGLSDDDLYLEVAPGRNRVIYLLGHLAAVHDRMLPLLGLGDRLYPQLDDAFISNPDKTIKDIPAPAVLREYWSNINKVLAAKFSSLTPDQWFQRHTAMTDDDFAKEPHRNKLSVLLSRTSHIASHQGQIILVKKS